MKRCPFCMQGPPAWCADWHKENHPNQTYQDWIADQLYNDPWKEYRNDPNP